MPNIAQQDYIIIDWEWKDADDAAKKAEVDAVLLNLYKSNPLALLSVVFKNYGNDKDEALNPVISCEYLEGKIKLCLITDTSLTPYSFDYN